MVAYLILGSLDEEWKQSDQIDAGQKSGRILKIFGGDWISWRGVGPPVFGAYEGVGPGITTCKSMADRWALRSITTDKKSENHIKSWDKKFQSQIWCLIVIECPGTSV